jgi:hypothetical protein
MASSDQAWFWFLGGLGACAQSEKRNEHNLAMRIVAIIPPHHCEKGIHHEDAKSAK